MDHVNLRLARRLKALRAKHHLTQEQLAEHADLSIKHVQRLESKRPCGVRLITLDRIAKAFGISLSELLKL
jgi:transcriptional regulator with XRE-family HTH domain